MKYKYYYVQIWYYDDVTQVLASQDIDIVDVESRNTAK